MARYRIDNIYAESAFWRTRLRLAAAFVAVAEFSETALCVSLNSQLLENVMRLFSIAAVGLITTAGLFLVGCAGSDDAGTAPASAPTTETEHGDHAEGGGDVEHGDHAEHGEHGDHAGHGGDDAMAKMKAGLAKLSDEDRASAEKQHMCPVSDEMLGTMGAPIKLTLNGQDVWICCDGCRKKAEADPDAIIAKVSK